MSAMQGEQGLYQRYEFLTFHGSEVPHSVFTLRERLRAHARVLRFSSLQGSAPPTCPGRVMLGLKK